jgi:hypothetical protein
MDKKNFQPYLSCHSTMMVELGRPKVAVESDAINSAIAAAGRRQARRDGESEPGRRQALPAAVALDILCEAERVTDPENFSTTAEELAELRPLLATVSCFQWLDRPRTGFSARWQDFGVSLGGAEEQLIFFEHENKTNRGGAHSKRSVALHVGPGSANVQRRLGRLLLRFKALKTTACPELAREGAAFWAIGGDASAAT